MLLLPTFVLTAVLATAVSATMATTVLPPIAYSGPGSIVASPFPGQTVVDMHFPTNSAPIVMLPGWQGSERRLHKRAPIGMDDGVEEVNLQKRRISTYFKYHPLRSQGRRDPKGVISVRDALTSPATGKGIIQLKKKYEGDESKKHLLGFEEKRTRETLFYAPLRRVAAIVSHHAKNLLGKVVKEFNDKKGKEILARNGKDQLQQNLAYTNDKHRIRIDKIHRDYNALPPLFYHGTGTAEHSEHYA